MAKKILVACFSASGVTKQVGEEIARIAGGDFFEIIPKEVYTSDDLNWMNKKSRSSVEMNDPSARPEIAGAVADMDAYDTVIVGECAIIRTSREKLEKSRHSEACPYYLSSSKGIFGERRREIYI